MAVARAFLVSDLRRSVALRRLLISPTVTRRVILRLLSLRAVTLELRGAITHKFGLGLSRHHEVYLTVKPSNFN